MPNRSGPGSVIGDCRLCDATSVPLQNSHIFPQWAYKRARDKTNAIGAPDPIMVGDGIAVQTSTQITEHMLCADCEQRFSRDEDYVSKLAFQDDETLGLLKFLSPGAIVPTGLRAFGTPTRLASIAHLDCQAIARFTASVFWRGHVARRQRLDSLRLWNPQAEALRHFLLGRKSLPNRMCMNLFVPVDGDDLTSMHSSTLTTPATGTKGDDSLHLVLIAGLLFTLTTGSISVPNICLACGRMPHVTIQHWRAFPFISNYARMAVTAMPKGKGARAATARAKGSS